jgi:hypothetical protein
VEELVTVYNNNNNNNNNNTIHDQTEIISTEQILKLKAAKRVSKI